MMKIYKYLLNICSKNFTINTDNTQNIFTHFFFFCFSFFNTIFTMAWHGMACETWAFYNLIKNLSRSKLHKTAQKQKKKKKKEWPLTIENKNQSKKEFKKKYFRAEKMSKAGYKPAQNRICLYENINHEQPINHLLYF